MSAKLLVAKAVTDAHILPYSKLPRDKSNGRVEKVVDDLHYMNREEVVFITLDFYNQKMQTSFKNVAELVQRPLSFDREVALRQELLSAYNLSPLIVVDEIPTAKVDLFLDAKIYEDRRERLKLI
jgi:hypothetical protein